MSFVAMYYPYGSEGYNLIYDAYVLAEKYFAKVTRLTSEKYIRHLEWTAFFVMVVLHRLGKQDPAAVAAGLLHDFLEDVPGWTKERLAEALGHGVMGKQTAAYVDDVTKRPVSDFDGSKARRDEEYKLRLLKVVLGSALIKIGDTCHNLVTQWVKSVERQRAKVSFAKTVCRELAKKHDLSVPELNAAIMLAEYSLSARDYWESLPLPKRS